MNRKILITGSKGFVGSVLGNHLRRVGFEVIDCFENLSDTEKLNDLFESARPEIVIHLAAKLDKFRLGREKDSFFEINLMGALNIINLCVKYGAKMIYFSSISAEFYQTKYGNKYGISKALAEDLVKAFTINQGLKAVVVRPCTLYNEVNGKNIDRFGREENVKRGDWYPLSKICLLVEKIVINDEFEKFKIYKTKLFRHYLNYLQIKIKKVFSLI